MLEPTVLVLGLEGFGSRTIVTKCCSGSVCIRNDDNNDNDNYNNASDSLNVSITGSVII